MPMERNYSPTPPDSIPEEGAVTTPVIFDHEMEYKKVMSELSNLRESVRRKKEMAGKHKHDYGSASARSHQDNPPAHQRQTFLFSTEFHNAQTGRRPVRRCFLLSTRSQHRTPSSPIHNNLSQKQCAVSSTTQKETPSRPPSSCQKFSNRCQMWHAKSNIYHSWVINNATTEKISREPSTGSAWTRQPWV